ncbi:hypothetical protein [Alicyclobacillus dauci]|uniref:Uncharacterized protein n=1 Tax=Alicyclobacillus dauci TaxID=1475485 RepID=A0ABY6Z8V7_9BACL|nr:hypothetical protein [Alicyclobacillus dauci]WAH38591.1 hypothetical protein NZD86_08965 [Alicyclobacillus dauci]
MTAVQKDVPRLTSGSIDWEKVLRAYAKGHGKRMFEAVQWLTDRPSLRVAVELLGFESNQASELGKWLDSRGYKVPPIMAEGDYATVGNPKKGVPEPTAEKVIAKIHVSATQRTSAQAVEPEGAVPYITVRIPLEYTRFPDSTDILNSSDRDGLIRNGIIFLQNAAAWATKDILDIMGEVDAVPIVQKFIDRKVEELSQQTLSV